MKLLNFVYYKNTIFSLLCRTQISAFEMMFLKIYLRKKYSFTFQLQNSKQSKQYKTVKFYYVKNETFIYSSKENSTYIISLMTIKEIIGFFKDIPK